MGGRGGSGGSNGGGVQGIPAASRNMLQSLKEIVNGVSDAEIYAALKECNMDPNEAVNRLLIQDPFHEVKSKREKKKELKDTTESRPRVGGSTSNRGARSGTDRFTGRGGSSQFSSSDSGGLHGKSKRENGSSSYTSSSTPAYGAASTNNTNRTPPAFTGYENKASTFSVADATARISQQPSSGFQSAWLSAPGQKSMVDIVRMGRPQNKVYSTPVPRQHISTNYDDYGSKASDIHQEQHDYHHVTQDDDVWPVIDPPQTVGVRYTGSEAHVESRNVDYERSNQYIDSQTEEGQVEDEDDAANHVSSRNLKEDASGSAYDNDLYQNMNSFLHQDHAFEHNEVEQGDALASAVSENMQQLNIQEERQLDESEDDAPSVVIPNHLQVQTADCSHLSFGSFVSTMNHGFSDSFASRQLRNKLEDTPAEVDSSSVGPSEARNSEYYGDDTIITLENNPVLRTGPNSGNYDLPSVSQREVLKQENSEATHGNQYGYSFDSTQLLNAGFPQIQTSTQIPNAAPFSNVMQAAYSTSLSANGHPVRESDLSYSPFSISQSMATKYNNSASSINGSTISMTEALKTGVFSSSQPTQQTPPGNSNTIPTGPALPHHLAVHPYSQPTLPFANMISYPYLPTYMPSGFQQAFAGNNSYHQQLAAILPQYKNSVSVSSLPQSASVHSGYGSFGNSTGNYHINQSAGSYDDVLSAHYKDNSQLLSLQQNENPSMWVQGGGSRTMSGSTYYGFQGQNQQPSRFRQSQQQPSQSYGGPTLNYQNYLMGISQEHQNPPLVGGAQSQPKPQQQLWQNSY